MPIKTILFDLDGTLLPMDQDTFVKTYFGLLARTLTPHGYDPQKLIETIWNGTMAMIANDGSKSNEEVFWDVFCRTFGVDARRDIPLFDAFYANVFDQVQASCGFTPKAAECIAALKRAGFRLVLATNPIFPAVATQSRIRWAGLNQDDFELITTYENSMYCKPNLDYYRAILQKINCEPADCLMVGNDVSDDLPAHELGMRVFLLTDCLINKNHADLTPYPHGGFDELMKYICCAQCD